MLTRNERKKWEKLYDNNRSNGRNEISWQQHSTADTTRSNDLVADPADSGSWPLNFLLGTGNASMLRFSKNCCDDSLDSKSSRPLARKFPFVLRCNELHVEICNFTTLATHRPHHSEFPNKAYYSEKRQKISKLRRSTSTTTYTSQLCCRLQHFQGHQHLVGVPHTDTPNTLVGPASWVTRQVTCFISFLSEEQWLSTILT